MEREGGGGGELWYLPHRERSRVEDQVSPFRTRHRLCRQEVAPADSQHLRVQDLAPDRQYSTEGRTGHQGWEGRNGDGNRDEGRDGREDEYGNKHESRGGGKNGSGNGSRDENRDEGGGEREPGNFYEVVTEVGRKTREGGRRQRVTNNHSRKTRRPSETVASC